MVVAVEGAAPPLSAKGPPLLPPVDMAAEVTVQSKSDEQGKQELDKLDGPAEQVTPDKRYRYVALPVKVGDRLVG